MRSTSPQVMPLPLPPNQGRMVVELWCISNIIWWKGGMGYNQDTRRKGGFSTRNAPHMSPGEWGNAYDLRRAMYMLRCALLCSAAQSLLKACIHVDLVHPPTCLNAECRFLNTESHLGDGGVQR